MIHYSQYDKDPGIYPTSSFIASLLGANKILIAGHSDPDGDALGSATALALALRDRGKEVKVGHIGRITPNLFFLMDPKELFFELPYNGSYLGEIDLLVFVDCHGPERVWQDLGHQEFLALPPFLVIDHHQYDGKIDGPIDIFHDPIASSTGELICRLLKAGDFTFTAPIVRALLTAIVSDTNFFTQTNATASALKEAGDLVALGGNLEDINVRLNYSWSIGRMRLLSQSLNSLELYCNGQLATMLLTAEMLRAADATLEDADGFVDYPRGIEGVLLAVFFKEVGRGKVKVSMRSRHPVSAREIAQAFGGGGHVMASAYTELTPFAQEAKERFLNGICRFFEVAK
ncbi:MAG: bifunctional oligoribonuclease/PAP phosphatase NrnA [Deltaproteobacteria bacterium]|jgi:phosphoesterase RecJ-like protein|nr:bifunctional oligoribonuclease/PAP phosphatase NrnA [Deltaproteobacteria bacterium]